AQGQGRMSGDALKSFLPEEKITERVVAAVKSVSEQAGKSMSQVALAWLRTRPVPVIPILGARKLSPLQDNLASFDWERSADQLKLLDEASRIAPGFPGRIFANPLSRALRFGGIRDRLLVPADI